MSGDLPGEAGRGSGKVCSQGLKYAVQVQVDGHDLPLKEFLHDVIGGALEGLLGGLRGVQDPQTFEIMVRRV